MVRRDSGINVPADLKGKRIGAARIPADLGDLVARVLQHEFGVHARDIDWHMERHPERATAAPRASRRPKA